MTPREQELTDRDLFRAAGERIGTMAEESRLTYERYSGQRGARQTAQKFYNTYAKLARLSKDVLELSR